MMSESVELGSPILELTSKLTGSVTPDKCRSVYL